MAEPSVRVIVDDGSGPDVLLEVVGTPGKDYRCLECEEVREDCLEERLYECPQCSGRFLQSQGGGRSGNLCPSCGNRFGSKLADKACAACEEGEVEEIEVVICGECDQHVEVDEWWEHVRDSHLG